MPPLPFSLPSFPTHSLSLSLPLPLPHPLLSPPLPRSLSQVADEDLPKIFAAAYKACTAESASFARCASLAPFHVAQARFAESRPAPPAEVTPPPCAIQAPGGPSTPVAYEHPFPPPRPRRPPAAPPAVPSNQPPPSERIPGRAEPLARAWGRPGAAPAGASAGPPDEPGGSEGNVCAIDREGRAVGERKRQSDR